MIDISRLPPPTIIESLSVDDILAQRLAQLKKQGVEIDNFTPSDPLYRNLLAGAYREMLVRQDINDKSLGTMLAFASGAQLDHIGATYYNVERQDGETDIEFIRRIQLSPEASSVAGPEGKYIFEALSAATDVKDASFYSPSPMHGEVTILSKAGSGAPDQALIDTVESHLMDDGVRPQTDVITVLPATISAYSITATLQLSSGPDTSQVVNQATAMLQSYVDTQHKLGGQVVFAGVYGALMVEGVMDVDLGEFTEVKANSTTAPYCTSLTVQGAS